MRTYEILADKAAQFNADSEIQEIIMQLNGGGESVYAGGYSKNVADDLKAQTFDVAALAARPLPYEKLDQLTLELLMGVR